QGVAAPWGLHVMLHQGSRPTCYSAAVLRQPLPCPALLGSRPNKRSASRCSSYSLHLTARQRERTLPGCGFLPFFGQFIWPTSDHVLHRHSRSGNRSSTLFGPRQIRSTTTPA